jgi:hypothetical protein
LAIKIVITTKSMAIEKCETEKGGNQNFVVIGKGDNQDFSDGKSMTIKTLATNVFLRIKIGDA